MRITWPTPFFWLVLMSLAHLRCSSYDLASEPPIEVPVNVDQPTWDNGIRALFAAKCDNCHSLTRPKFAPSNALPFGFSTKESTVKGLKLRIETRVFSQPDDPMPPNYGTPLLDAELFALQTYLLNLP